MALNSTWSNGSHTCALCFGPWGAFFNIYIYIYMVDKKCKCSKWPRNDHEHLTGKGAMYTKYLAPMPKFLSITLQPVYEIEDYWKSEMHQITSESAGKLVKSTMYTLYKYFWDPNFCPLHSIIELFLWYKNVKDLKCTEWPKNNLEHLMDKITQYTLIKYLHLRPKFWSVFRYNQIVRYKVAKSLKCT